MATTMGNLSAKKMAWERLTEEYNSIETNTKRTEAQLKKCWDNLKTRRKSLLVDVKKGRMKTGGGKFDPKPSTSSQGQLLDDALAEQTDVELLYVTDSDFPETASTEDMQIDSGTGIPEVSQRRESINETVTERDCLVDTPPRNTESRLSNYGSAPSQGSRNVRARVIQEEFCIRQETYNKAQKREEELHKYKITEKEWMVKAAEEHYLKAKAEREAAEELLRCNRAKREEAELRLLMFKNKK